MRNKATRRPASVPLPQIRIVGSSPSASAVMAQVAQQGHPAVEVAPPGQLSDSDYAQIDNGLVVDARGDKRKVAPPIAGVGYAGLTPAQRHEFLLWLQAPVIPAPPAFQHLCLANLEVRLFESPEWASAARGLLLELHQAAAWEGEDRLARALLLAFWLARDGAQLAAWIASGRTPMALLGIVLGCQAMLGVPLSASQTLTIATAWRLAPPFAPAQVIELRLASLQERLGAEALNYALAQLPEEARQPRPWRCTHRDLRISIPQPDLRPALTPLLAEIVTAGESATVRAQKGAGASLLGSDLDSDLDNGLKNSIDNEGLTADSGWSLILEFQEGTSGLAPIAVRRAQRMTGYTSLMDEHRRVLHRVRFRKREMQSFWYLWDIVHDWTYTHVYLNGAELEKWKVSPYGPYLG